MASSPIDNEIRLTLRKLKAESVQIAIESQLKKHVAIIKDLVNVGISIAIIAEQLSGAGVTGNIKDIIAAITTLLASEASINPNNEEDDDQQDNLSKPSTPKPPSAKKQPKALPSVDAQEPPTSPPSINSLTIPAIEFAEETATPITASTSSNAAVAAPETPYSIPNRRTPEVQAKVDAAKAGQALQQT